MLAASELESSSKKEITNIPTFNGEYFHEWKFKIQLVLEGKYVWKVVQPVEEETSEEESTGFDIYIKKPEQPSKKKTDLHIPNTNLRIVIVGKPSQF
ncbi:hypothetical protein K7432_018186 [Basidiobolus ranarum]|uniref:DUF4219 domain-containing protein n=1 Tax=Basidiobolus ranarum TaxID=34480 RepID=A0ABR2VJD7_9FUNG